MCEFQFENDNRGEVDKTSWYLRFSFFLSFFRKDEFQYESIDLSQHSWYACFTVLRNSQAGGNGTFTSWVSVWVAGLFFKLCALDTGFVDQWHVSKGRSSSTMEHGASFPFWCIGLIQKRMGLVLLSGSLFVPTPICVLLAADNLHTVMCVLHIYIFGQTIECHEDLLILLLYRKNQKAQVISMIGNWMWERRVSS